MESEGMSTSRRVAANRFYRSVILNRLNIRRFAPVEIVKMCSGGVPVSVIARQSFACNVVLHSAP